MEHWVIGVKVNVGPGRTESSSMEEILKESRLSVDPRVLSPANSARAVYYDDISGDLIFHFMEPVRKDKLLQFFTEEEIVPATKEQMDLALENRRKNAARISEMANVLKAAAESEVKNPPLTTPHHPAPTHANRFVTDSRDLPVVELPPHLAN